MRLWRFFAQLNWRITEILLDTIKTNIVKRKTINWNGKLRGREKLFSGELTWKFWQRSSKEDSAVTLEMDWLWAGLNGANVVVGGRGLGSWSALSTMSVVMIERSRCLSKRRWLCDARHSILPARRRRRRKTNEDKDRTRHRSAYVLIRLRFLLAEEDEWWSFPGEILGNHCFPPPHHHHYQQDQE